ncbi:MAG: hypothetical protein NTV34_18030 [Proteobacteria bacterium]|nr:hypothetical protein [Pseudomonadota bacterium]
MSTWSLISFNAEAHERLEKFESIVKSKLTVQEILHDVATSINLNGKKIWLQTICNDLWTLFYPHGKRGSEAKIAIGVLDHFCVGSL